jgi:TonB dependent receptor/TonB-dependent Receptor Plug Domain
LALVAPRHVLAQENAAPQLKPNTLKNANTSTKSTIDHGLSQMDMRQRTLPSLLTIYQRQGYSLIFSDDLVTSSMIIRDNPATTEPLARLQSVLSQFGLALQQQPEIEAWYVVSDENAIQRITLFIKDQITHKPIANAALSIGRISTANQSISSDRPSKIIYSDNSGKILLQKPFFETVSIRIAHSTHQPFSISSNNISDGDTVLLVPRPRLIEEVVVTSSTYRWLNPTLASAYDFDGQDILTQPTRGGDVVQVMNTLPGAASSGVSAKPNIRGGEQSELQILFDGVELLDPFHLKDFQSLISGINSSIVGAMDVYTGGYTARFGSRMSGVLDIQLLEDADYANELEHNFLATSGKASGRLLQDQWQWQIAGRRGNIDETVDKFNANVGTPRFSDVFAKLRWQRDEHNILDIGTLSIMDDITLNQTSSGESAHSVYESQYLWLKNISDATPDDTRQWLFTYAQIANRRNGIRESQAVLFDSSGNIFDQRDFNIVRLEYRRAVDLAASSDVEWGGKLEYATAEYDYRLQSAHGQLGLGLGRPALSTNTMEADIEGAIGDAFFSYRFDPWDKLHVETGLRLDAQNFAEDFHHQVSPRLAAKYQLNDSVHIKANAGRFYQAPQITELDVEAQQNDFYPSQKADHYVLGLGYEYDQSLRWSLEAYQKRIYTPRPRHENLFDRYLLLPELAPDRITLAPTRAHSRGVELRVEKQFDTNLEAWASYTLSRAEDEFAEGHTQLRSWDQLHSFSSGFQYSLRNWQWSTQLQWHSGWPIMQIPEQLNQDVMTFNSLTDIERNGVRLQDYLSLNTKITYQWQRQNSVIKAYLDITNTTNNENIGGYRYENPGDDPNTLEVNATPQKLFPRLPILGVQWQF